MTASGEFGDLVPHLVEEVRYVVATRSPFGDEETFHRAYSARLSPSSNKVLASFDPPLLPPKQPRWTDIEACRARGLSLPIEGRDPCGGTRRQIDVIWDHGAPVAIELKVRERWQSDTYGYDVLKDVHRLERLRELRRPGAARVPQRDRYVVFVANIPDYWSVPTREPTVFRLTDGRAIPPRYWVQYEQPSPVTRWHAYPPFYLYHSYSFSWADVGAGYRCLVLRVLPQGLASAS